MASPGSGHFSPIVAAEVPCAHLQPPLEHAASSYVEGGQGPAPWDADVEKVDDMSALASRVQSTGQGPSSRRRAGAAHVRPMGETMDAQALYNPAITLGLGCLPCQACAARAAVNKELCSGCVDEREGVHPTKWHRGAAERERSTAPELH